MAPRARTIVVGYDGSDASARALDAAADLVGYGSTLTVVSVCPSDGTDLRTSARQAREHLVRRHVPARYLELPGEPAEAIASAARTLDAKLIVVGLGAPISPGSRAGSVGTEFLSQAPCDVLVVR